MCPACHGRWSSVQARFDPEEERVLGQRCKDCQQFGDVITYQFCAPASGTPKADERKPHRSDLCEACSRFGNCQGAFFEPFVMSSAIALLMGRAETKWSRSGSAFVADAGRFAVAMLPHAYDTAAAGDVSWSVDSNCGNRLAYGRGKGSGK